VQGFITYQFLMPSQKAGNGRSFCRHRSRRRRPRVNQDTRLRWSFLKLQWSGSFCPCTFFRAVSDTSQHRPGRRGRTRTWPMPWSGPVVPNGPHAPTGSLPVQSPGPWNRSTSARSPSVTQSPAPPARVGAQSIAMIHGVRWPASWRMPRWVMIPCANNRTPDRSRSFTPCANSPVVTSSPWPGSASRLPFSPLLTN